MSLSPATWKRRKLLPDQVNNTQNRLVQSVIYRLVHKKKRWLLWRSANKESTMLGQVWPINIREISHWISKLCKRDNRGSGGKGMRKKNSKIKHGKMEHAQYLQDSKVYEGAEVVHVKFCWMRMIFNVWTRFAKYLIKLPPVLYNVHTVCGQEYRVFFLGYSDPR